MCRCIGIKIRCVIKLAHLIFIRLLADDFKDFCIALDG